MSTEKKGSKKPKKKLEKPGSSQYSDNRLKIEGDANTTAFVVGDNNRVELRATQPKPLEVPPYEGNDWLLVTIGRWIMRTFFKGNMKHSLKSFTFVISVLSIVIGSFSFGPLFLDPNYFVKNAYLELAWIIAFSITLFGGGGVVEISRRTTCSNCGQKFMFTRKKKLVTGQGTHQGMEITNYRSTYSCDNCGYTRRNIPEVGKREIPAGDSDDADDE